MNKEKRNIDPELKALFDQKGFQFQREYDQAIQKVESNLQSFHNARYIAWNALIQFNAIIISSFAIILAINNKINNIHFLVISLFSFLSIGLIGYNIFSIKYSLRKMLDRSIIAMLNKIPIFRGVKEILNKKENNRGVSKNDKNDEPKIISQFEKAAIALTISNVAYFIYVIYISM